MTDDTTLAVALVSNDDEGERISVVWRGLVEEVSLPEIESIETGLIRDVEGEDTCVGTAVESESDTLVFFLTSRVPHLQRHLLAIDSDLLRFEVSADRSLRGCRAPSGKHVDKGCLTDADVAKKDDLGEELLLVRFNH